MPMAPYNEFYQKLI